MAILGKAADRNRAQPGRLLAFGRKTPPAFRMEVSLFHGYPGERGLLLVLACMAAPHFAFLFLASAGAAAGWCFRSASDQ